jgi:hypothetical protein
LLIMASLMLNLLPQARAEQESPYRLTEHAIRTAPGNQSWPANAGKWLAWSDDPRDTQRIAVRNLASGQEYTVTAGNSLGWPVDVGGEVIVTAEMDFDQVARRSRYGIFGYRLPEGQRFTIAALEGGTTASGAPFYRSPPRTDGKTVVWAEGGGDSFAIRGYDLAAQRLITIGGEGGLKEAPAISDGLVAWRDRRHTGPTAVEADIYGYELASGQEFRITPGSESVGFPVVAGRAVFWIVRRGDSAFVVGYDVATRQALSLAELALDPMAYGLDAEGDLVVWSTRGELDEDVFAYDLKQGKQFLVSRAIGSQNTARISGRMIVWADGRRGGVGKYESDYDLYGAQLDNGPGPLPPAIGVPAAADAKIEIVWPHGGAPVAESDRANVGVWLFLPDSMRLAPCQWNPTVRLWRAIDNEPAKQVATGQRVARHYAGSQLAVPVFVF